jgi:hypothetical protein
MIPQLGPVREQSRPVTRTPEFQSPLTGAVLMQVTMTATQETTVRPAFKDKKGNPATVDGQPQYFTDNSDVLALEPQDDGSCVVRAVGPLGVAKLTMLADADLGEGREDLIGTVDFDITGGKATVVELEVAPPTEQE